MLRRPLQQPYDGPFKVFQRKDKVFFLDINGKRVSVSIDRCKPAFFLNTEDLQLPQTKNETPATVEPNATASTPATVESDPTASTPTQPSTRSGGKVHLPTRRQKSLEAYQTQVTCLTRLQQEVLRLHNLLRRQESTIQFLKKENQRLQGRLTKVERKSAQALIDVLEKEAADFERFCGIQYQINDDR
ncbi:uncharacterized protein TNCV_801661 [Trichonephila clavipes]|nr:uncharacterized protein TNCV_801661 [Trichonephila clavipes]